MALALCIAAFVACYWAGKRSLGQGLLALLVFGYFYGILRANVLSSFSHFIFDAGLLGLYLARLWRKSDAVEAKRTHAIVAWVFVLVCWPLLLVFMPFQPLLVSLVGLRGNAFFVPLLILGSRLKAKDLIELSVGLAVLDLVAVVFAGLEYFQGVPRYFPMSPVTRIIYASGDVAGGFFRIPAIFSNAHAYGGCMVGSLPFLIGLWTNAPVKWQRLLGLIAIPVAMLGVLMSATRLNFVFGCLMIGFLLFTTKMQMKQRMIFIVVLAVISGFAVTNSRLSRFKTLGDNGTVVDRIAGSVNRGFWEILEEYPMGNGLGGGGSSIPYFLEGQVRNPIGMENEYARILSEQGVIGLLLWIGFLGWYFANTGKAFAKSGWSTTRRLMWGMSVIGFGTAWVGIGLLTAIPETLMLLIGVGWTAVAEAEPSLAPRSVRVPLRRNAAVAFREYNPGWSNRG